MRQRARGPGLAKTRGERLLQVRRADLVRAADAGWSGLFERADVMSEGARRDDGHGDVYYGTTSVLLPLASLRSSATEAAGVARALAANPHARLRAVRIACREALVRSGEPLGCVRAEVFVRSNTEGVRIDIEVEAPVLPGASEPRSSPRGIAPARRSP